MKINFSDAVKAKAIAAIGLDSSSPVSVDQAGNPFMRFDEVRAIVGPSNLMMAFRYRGVEVASVFVHAVLGDSLIVPVASGTIPLKIEIS